MSKPEKWRTGTDPLDRRVYDESGEPVAIVVGDNVGDEHRRRSLVAASPALLAVCQKLQEYFDSGGTFDLNDVRDMADDAVRAALPEPPQGERGKA